MAINKKGSRLICVDHQTYRWTVRKQPTYCNVSFGESKTCAVESLNKGLCVLLIQFPWPRTESWMCVGGHSITPKLVEICIREALQQGWQPHRKGSAFKLLLNKEQAS